MHLFSSLARLAALGLVALLPSAHAQLSLSGSTRGEFTGSDSIFTWISNGPVTSTLYTGLPTILLPTTHIQFNGDSFTGVGDNDTFDLGRVHIRNGITLFDTAASLVTMDLYLNLPANGILDHKLTTLTFAIENTPNFGFVPDVFFISYSTPASIKVDNTLVDFALSFSDNDYIESGQWIGEKKLGSVDLYATVNFTPVPEPSTYAACAAAGLIGLVAWRRTRRPAPATT
jgi:PEP-CTERM motif.